MTDQAPDPAPEPKRAKAPDPAPEPSDGRVTVRVVKNGAGKVCTGEWDVENNCAATYPKDAMVTLPADIAQELEDRLFVEIQ